jgi:hypothetical protein
MESQINNTAVIVDGSSPVKGVGSNLGKKLEDLSYLQKQRYNYLYNVFQDQTAFLVSLIEGRGRNSWAKVNEKITVLDQAKHNEQNYHDALYDNFEIGNVYTSAEITGIVGDVRRDNDLRPYMSRIKINCEADFFNLFIVHDVYHDITNDGKVTSQFIGYKPVFKLKADD